MSRRGQKKERILIPAALRVSREKVRKRGVDFLSDYHRLQKIIRKGGI
jgi:hypothetical protein